MDPTTETTVREQMKPYLRDLLENEPDFISKSDKYLESEEFIEVESNIQAEKHTIVAPFQRALLALMFGFVLEKHDQVLII